MRPPDNQLLRERNKCRVHVWRVLQDAEAVHEIEAFRRERKVIDVSLNHVETRVRSEVLATRIHGVGIVHGHEPGAGAERDLSEPSARRSRGPASSRGASPTSTIRIDRRTAGVNRLTGHAIQLRAPEQESAGPIIRLHVLHYRLMEMMPCNERPFAPRGWVAGRGTSGVPQSTKRGGDETIFIKPMKINEKRC